MTERIPASSTSPHAHPSSSLFLSVSLSLFIQVAKVTYPNIFHVSRVISAHPQPQGAEDEPVALDETLREQAILVLVRVTAHSIPTQMKHGSQTGKRKGHKLKFHVHNCDFLSLTHSNSCSFYSHTHTLTLDVMNTHTYALRFSLTNMAL